MADTLKLFCNLCSRPTRHEQLREWAQSDASGELIRYMIVQCAGCESVSFYRAHLAQGQNGLEVVEYDTYPPTEYRHVKHFVGALANVDSIYRETIQAFNNSSLILCAAGLRALVEGICADQGIMDGPKTDPKTGKVHRESNLECKIEGLAEKNILTQRQARTLHEHRYLGNKALHELGTPDKATLEIALDVIEHIMEDLYNLPHRAAGLEKIRQNAESNHSKSYMRHEG